MIFYVLVFVWWFVGFISLIILKTETIKEDVKLIDIILYLLLASFGLLIPIVVIILINYDKIIIKAKDDEDDKK